MPLVHVNQAVSTSASTMRPTFPMKDGAKTVSVSVSTEALDKLGAGGDYEATCEAHRMKLEQIASGKYTGMESSVSITSADV